MDALVQDCPQEELDSKKRKDRILTNNRMKDSAGFQKVPGKGLKLPILKRSTCSKKDIPVQVVDLMDLTCSGKSLACLCLMIDVPLGKDHVKRHRLILERLFSSIKSVDLQSVIMSFETEIGLILRKQSPKVCN